MLDLAATVAPRELERALDEALVRRLTSVTQVQEVLSRASRRIGAPSLQRLLDECGHPTITRCEAEEGFLALVRRAELPTPQVNVSLHGFTVDFFWPEHRLVVEVDGYAFHHTRSAFERDRRKDAVLARAGLLVIRVTWSQLEAEPYAVIARIVYALARFGPA